MGSEGVVGDHGVGDQLGLLRTHPRVHVLAPVAVGPAVEGPLADRGQVVGDQLRADLVALVDHGPEGAGGRLDGQGGRVADAGGDGAPRAGDAVHGPDHGPLLLDRHAALADVRVGADADIESLAVGAGGQGLGPVVVDLRRQARDPLGRGGDAGLAVLVREADQLVLLGDVEVAVDEGEAVGGVQVVDEDGADLGSAVVVRVAQQGDAVAALDLRIALLLDDPGDDILGTQGGRAAAAAFGDEDVAVGQDQHLARDLQVRGQGGDGVAGRRGRDLVAPADRLGDLHRRQQGLTDAREVGLRPGLVQIGIAAAAGGDGEQGGGADEGADHRATSRLRMPEYATKAAARATRALRIDRIRPKAPTELQASWLCLKAFSRPSTNRMASRPG